jgi:hypothetical protein
MGLSKIIKPSTSVFRRLLFLETFFNLQSKVTKASDDSVISGVAGGVARIAGKAEKDVFLALSSLFPELAYGSQLDQVAANNGIAPRFTQIGSTTYVRITANPGTVYQAGVHNFVAQNGIQFALLNDITITDFGFGYAKVVATTTGDITNVDAYTISQVSPQPNGHVSCLNEVSATGGFDNETDDTFKVRIQNGANILARNTLASLEQVLILLDNRVLRIYHQGINDLGQVVIAIATQNGVDFSSNELKTLLDGASGFFTLSDYKPYNKGFYGVIFQNIEYQPIDVSFRVSLDGTRNVDDVRRDIQIQMSKALDYRFFDPSQMAVEWDNLLDVVKTTLGVKYVPDQYFSPRVDIAIDLNKLPRMRSFVMADLNGTVLSSSNGVLNPIYYPNTIDFDYVSILRQL